jgi:hypothetical protein
MIVSGVAKIVLSVATRNVPGIETPVPPPIVTPLRIATCGFRYVPSKYIKLYKLEKNSLIASGLPTYI